MSIDTKKTFAPSPTSFPPTPRRVRLRRVPYLILSVLLLFTAVGIVIFYLSFGRLALGVVGQSRGVTVEGRITDKTQGRSGRRNHSLLYTFRVEGEDHTVTLNVDDASFERVKVGDAVQVRVWPFWPAASATIDEPTLARSWNDVCFFGFVTLWDGILILAVFYLTRLGLCQRNLARHGIATIGSVTDKRVGQHKGPVFVVSYRFKRSDGAECDARMDVQKADYDALNVGEPITVLYDPHHPETNVLYSCGEFGVIGVE